MNYKIINTTFLLINCHLAFSSFLSYLLVHILFELLVHIVRFVNKIFINKLTFLFAFSRFLSCLLVHIVCVVDGIFLKHLTPRPGGIIDTLTKPKIPQLGSHGGLSFGIGPFGISFGYKKEYVPGGVNVPPGHPHVPEVKPEYPEEKPWEKPVIPNVPEGKPIIPNVPEVKPEKPGYAWEEEMDEVKVPKYPRPSPWNKGEKDHSKPGSYEEDKKDYPKPGYEQDKGYPKREDKDDLPDWEDIGETSDTDSKSENFMNSDLVGAGFLQPRLKNRRNKRFIESRVYHVPLIYRSNAKPYRVKIENKVNNLMKESLII